MAARMLELSPNITTKLSQLIPDFKSYNLSLDNDELKEMDSKIIDVLEDLQTEFQVANLPHILFSDTDREWQGLSVIRGYMTSGEEWTFFVYKSPTASGGKEALFSFSKPISLGSKLERLPLTLGLLKDMVANPFNFEQKYFKSHLACQDQL